MDKPVSNEVVAVSACLLGFACRYDGQTKLNHSVINMIKGKKVIPICPETLGGMNTPRIVSEIQKDGLTVLNQQGLDVTCFFNSGKEQTLLILRQNNCKQAILKDGSPSCGTTCIYDGSFTNQKIKGEGITCQYLKANGIEVIGE